MVDEGQLLQYFNIYMSGIGWHVLGCFNSGDTNIEFDNKRIIPLNRTRAVLNMLLIIDIYINKL